MRRDELHWLVGPVQAHLRKTVSVSHLALDGSRPSDVDDDGDPIAMTPNERIACRRSVGVSRAGQYRVLGADESLQKKNKVKCITESRAAQQVVLLLFGINIKV